MCAREKERDTALDGRRSSNAVTFITFPREKRNIPAVRTLHCLKYDTRGESMRARTQTHTHTDTFTFRRCLPLHPERPSCP